MAMVVVGKEVALKSIGPRPTLRCVTSKGIIMNEKEYFQLFDEAHHKENQCGQQFSK